MEKFDRFQSLHRIFSSHQKPVALSMLAERMECSKKTVKRTIEQMRDYFHAPIEYFHDGKGWHYNAKEGEVFELPGLWLTGEELQSLTLLLHVLEGFGNGLLNKELAFVEHEVDKLLEARGIATATFSERIKVLPLNNRSVANTIFMTAGEAILNRQQLQISYVDYNGKKTTRCISPQQLVHYRDNWYMDAWCHSRNELRVFLLSRIDKITLLDKKAKDISKAQLTENFSSGYGIFSGKAESIACLRFLSPVARDIAMQQWHPQQHGEWEGEEYLLSFPYSDDRELIGDIQRHLPHVMVEAPAGLKNKVQRRIQESLKLYG